MERRRRLLALGCHAVLPAAALAAAYLFSLSPFSVNCVFRRVTGWLCPTCGSTRAVFALLQLRLGRSLLLNPLPIMLALLWLAVTVFEAVCLLGHSRARFPLLPFVYTIFGLEMAFWLARNLGLIVNIA